MPGWLLLMLLPPLAAAMLLWQNVAKSKEISDKLLDEYAKLLTESRHSTPTPGAGGQKPGGESNPERK